MTYADNATLAAMWTEAAHLNGIADSLDDAAWDRLFALEDRVLTGRIATRADAIAKLKAVGLAFERGDRLDGADEAGLADAIRWLEAH